MRPCFAFTPAAKANEPATLSIYDEIGFWGVQAKDFIKDLQAVSAKVLNVEINSPGGDVFAGLAIYNALRASGKEIVVKVMGVAASAASLIAMAGDKIIMPKNTMMMVHNPWSFAIGNAEELRETAATLDKIGDSLLKTYASRTGKPEDEIKPLLAKDTWLTADEALEMGFATEVVDEIKAKAKFDMARADLPENVKAMFKAGEQGDIDPEDPDADPQSDPTPDPVPEPESDVAKAVYEQAVKAGLPEDGAKFLAVASETVEDGQKRIAAARQIVTLCSFVKKPEAVAGYLAKGTSLADVRKEIAAQLAQAADTTATKPNPNEPKATTRSADPGVINSKSAWDRHNANVPQSKVSKKGK